MAGFHAFHCFKLSLLEALRAPRLIIEERSGHAFIGDFTIDVYGGKPEWDSNLEVARPAGAEIENAVHQAITIQQEQQRIPEVALKSKKSREFWWPTAILDSLCPGIRCK
jgi:hypothetical protein